MLLNSNSCLLRSRTHVPGAANLRSAVARRAVTVRAQADPSATASGTRPSTRPIIPEPTLTPDLLKLAATMPNDFSIALLNGGKYAKTQQPGAPGGGYLYWIADPNATDVWLGDEWGMGVRPGWPTSLRRLIGDEAINTTYDYNTYRKTRDLIDANILCDEAVTRALPDIQKVVKLHTGKWADQKDVKFHPIVRYLVMDVVFNVALRLNLTYDEVVNAANLSAQWAGGIVGSIDASPETKAAFDKGMTAREQLTTLYKSKLHASNLPKGLASAMRDAFGVDNQSTLNMCFALTFAGLETSSSVTTNMIRHLAAHPEAVKKVKAEAAHVHKTHSTLTTLAAQQAMGYTYGVVREALRMTYAVGAVPKQAKEAPLTKPENAAELPQGCPFQAAWKAMSVLDPSVKNDRNEFKPERWLDAESVKSLKKYQHPFGSGTRECPGGRVMQAMGALLSAELATHYKFTADGNTTFNNIGIPENFLPGRVERV